MDEVNDSFAVGRYRETAPMTETAGARRINRSPLRNTNTSYDYYPATAQKRTPAPPINSDLFTQVETLQRERDHFASEAAIEKSKNLELEKEFMILRSLIVEN